MTYSPFCSSISLINIGIGGAVDDDINAILLNHLAHGIKVGDIEISGLGIFRDIGEDIAVGTTLCDSSYLVAQLTVGARNQNLICHR